MADVEAFAQARKYDAVWGKQDISPLLSGKQCSFVEDSGHKPEEYTHTHTHKHTTWFI